MKNYENNKKENLKDIIYVEYQEKYYFQTKELVLNIMEKELEIPVEVIHKTTNDIYDICAKYIENDGNFWVAIDNMANKVIGTIGVMRIDNNNAELKRFYVKKNYRGMHIGANLYQIAEKFSKEKEIENLYLVTGNKSIKAKKIYNKNGWHEANGFEKNNKIYVREGAELYVNHLNEGANMKEKKKLLILGGTPDTCDIVRKAKEMGIYTIVTDWNDEQKSPAKKIADKSYMISLAETDKIVELIKQENISGVLTGFTDSYLEFYYNICKKAKLHCYGNLEQFKICTDKEQFKKVCREVGVPVIKEYKISNELREDEINKIEYPVIVKPIDSSGSRGVFVCKNDEELKKYYLKSLEYSPSKKVIVEKCINAQHVNMYYTIINGKAILSAMADRFVYFQNEHVAPTPYIMIHPSKHLKEYMNKVDEKVKELFKKLDMRNGVVFVQGFYEQGEFYIYEIGYRLNGGATFYLIDECCNYNQLEMLINYSLYGEMTDTVDVEKLQQPDFNGKVGANLIISLKQGKIKKILGLEEIKKMQGIVSVVQKHFEGEELNSIGTTGQNFAYILIVEENEEELRKVANKVYEKLSILDENNNEMIIRNL